jgi:hypothetical protein
VRNPYATAMLNNRNTARACNRWRNDKLKFTSCFIVTVERYSAQRVICSVCRLKVQHRRIIYYAITATYKSNQSHAITLYTRRLTRRSTGPATAGEF